MSDAEPLVAGVDGCPAGWVAVIGSRGERVWVVVERRLEAVLAKHPRAGVWAVDMPIGLATDGPRPSDAEARRRLGRKRSASVFPAPPHAALADGIETHAEACEVAERVTGKRVSKQAWNLAPKIREVRGLLIDQPSLRRRLCETHPELTFARLAGGCGLAEGKKTEAGQTERRRLLAGQVGDATIERVVAQAQATRGLAVDDALDAVACWLAAKRVAQEQAECLPDEPPLDPDGLPCCIRY